MDQKKKNEINDLEVTVLDDVQKSKIKGGGCDQCGQVWARAMANEFCPGTEFAV